VNSGGKFFGDVQNSGSSKLSIFQAGWGVLSGFVQIDSSPLMCMMFAQYFKLNGKFSIWHSVSTAEVEPAGAGKHTFNIGDSANLD
jgi:hypothetical protein